MNVACQQVATVEVASALMPQGCSSEEDGLSGDAEGGGTRIKLSSE